MSKYSVNILLVENDTNDALLILSALADDGHSMFQVQCVSQIQMALDLIARRAKHMEGSFDIILLDINASSDKGRTEFTPLYEAAPEALILVLSNSENEIAAQALVKHGAYDYLKKEHVNAHWLPRALRYVSERKQVETVLRQSEEALFEEKERAQVTLNSIGDAVIATDLSGKVSFLNLMAETMTGWKQAEALGRRLEDVFRIIDGKTRQVTQNPAQRAMRDDQIVGLAADCVLISRDGKESDIEDSSAPIHNRDGQVSGAVIVFHDVSASRAMAQKMTHLAKHDVLTGQPNRMLLQERLAQAIAQAQRHHRQLALMYLDLDYFKYVNDSLGHAIGDQLLVSVAKRLQQSVRASDTVCRQGGDEFVILLTQIEHPQDAAQSAGKILAALAEPHQIGLHELHVGVSIGISIYPNDGLDVESMMKNADTAMYHAKSSGRNNHQFFRNEMNQYAKQRLSMEGGLRRAINAGEFILHYQPQIDLETGAMNGAEALIRWQQPEKGMLYPDCFVPIAEESGLIVPIGRWVLGEACRQIRAWLDAGLHAVPIAVNVSAVELRHPQFVDGVRAALSASNVPVHYLKMELTEGVLINDTEASKCTLDKLRTMGVRLAIDDFGTGYSSLGYLKRFPIDTLKIDRSFIRDMATDPDAATIVNAVVGMGRNLKQRVVAEGVETTRQLSMLRTQRCDSGQGFKFSHPLDALEFARCLAKVHRRPLQSR